MDYLYRHAKIRHYKVGEFEFKNHLLTVKGEAANDRFLDLLEKLPARSRNPIISIDPEALRRLENDPLKKRKAIRGAQGTTDILAGAKGSAPIRPQIQVQQDPGDESGASAKNALLQKELDALGAGDPTGTTPPAPDSNPKPAGIDMAAFMANQKK